MLTEAIQKGNRGTYKTSGFEIEPRKAEVKRVDQNPAKRYWGADACDSDEESATSNYSTKEDDLDNEDICDGSSVPQLIEATQGVEETQTHPSNQPLEEDMNKGENQTPRDLLSWDPRKVIFTEEEEEEVQALLAWSMQDPRTNEEAT